MLHGTRPTQTRLCLQHHHSEDLLCLLNYLLLTRLQNLTNVPDQTQLIQLAGMREPKQFPGSVVQRVSGACERKVVRTKSAVTSVCLVLPAVQHLTVMMFNDQNVVYMSRVKVPLNGSLAVGKRRHGGCVTLVSTQLSTYVTCECLFVAHSHTSDKAVSYTHLTLPTILRV